MTGTGLRRAEQTDSGTGSANAATLDKSTTPVVPDQALAVFWDTSGAATLNIEIKTDGNWKTLQSKSISSADDGIEVHEVPYTEARAYLDSNRNSVVISGVTRR